MDNQPYVDAGTVLLKAKEDLETIFTEPEYQASMLLCSHQLNQLINRMHFLGGSTPVATPTEKFPPITNFMGEEISRAEVKAADVIPEDLEKNIFLDKVEALYDVFEHMSTDKILNSYTIPEDVLVLRGVAKKAGIKGAHNRKLTVDFIEDIRAGILTKAAEAEKRAAYEADLAAKHDELPDGEMSAGQAKAATLNEAAE